MSCNRDNSRKALNGRRIWFGCILLTLVIVGASLTVKNARAALPAPGGYDTNIQLWLRADNAAFEDAGQSDATEDGDVILSWTDGSGNGYDATDASGTAIWRENSVNFNPAIDFDGDGDYIGLDNTNADNAIGNKSTLSIFSVQHTDTPTPATERGFWDDSTSTLNAQFQISQDPSIVRDATNATNGYYMDFGTDLTSTVRSNIISSTPTIVGGTWVDTGSSTIRVDGHEEANFYYLNLTSNTLTSGVNGVDYLRFGMDEGSDGTNNAADDYDGRTAEVVIYNGVPGASDIGKIESYLGMKYGITLHDVNSNAEYLLQDANTGNTNNNSLIAQSFTATTDGVISGISIRGWNVSTATQADIYICNGDVDATTCQGAPAQSTTGVTLTFPGASHDWVDMVFDDPTGVTSGQQYTIAMQPNNNWTYFIDTSNSYAGGTYYIDGIDQAGDLRFRILGEEIIGYDYQLSNGTNTWSGTTTDAAYHNDVAALARDSNSALDQKVSQSTDGGAVVIMSTEQNFTASNVDAARTTSLTDFTSIMWGHDNAGTAFGSTYDGNANRRMNQIWKVREAGAVGNVYVAIPNSTAFPESGNSVIVSSDTTFDSGDTAVTLTDDGTYYWAQFNPADGQYFTFASTTVASGALEYSGFNISQSTSTGNFDPSVIGVTQSLDIVFEPGSGGTVAYISESGSSATKVNLSTPYDISSYTSFSTFTVPNNTTDIVYNNDGSKVYYTSYVTRRVHEYDLATNYDLATGTSVDDFDYNTATGGAEQDPYSTAFNADGTKMFMAGEDTDLIYEYNLSPAYDVSTAVASGTTLDLTTFYTASGTGANNNNVRNVEFAQDGRRMYIVNDLLAGPTYDVVIEVAMTTPYDLTTASYVNHIQVSGISPLVSLSAIGFDDNGQEMFFTSSGGEIYTFDTNQNYPEAVANDGSIDSSTPLVITLTGDTFADADADNILDVGSEVVIGNVPPGLTPSIALSAGDTVATLTFSGNATNNQDADDVGNLTFAFADSAFSTASASNITNSGSTTAYSSYVGIDFEDNPQVSGTVYTDEGTTNIGAGKTVTLLINGALADCGGGAGSCQADTNASGYYIIQGTDVDAMTGGEVLTVFIDDETEKGVSVTVTEDDSQTGFNIYQNYLITRHDNSGSLTNANLVTATNADTDIDAIYTVAGTVLTTTTGTELLVWAGDTFTPGDTIVAGGTIDVDGTFNIGTNSISIAGDLDVGNTFSTTAGSSITMNGTGAQGYNQGSGQINADLIVSGTGVVTLTTNRLLLGTNDLTISAGATLNINGMNITTATGTFSNEGTLQVNGEELLITLTQDTDSGTWEFIDDADGSASVVSIDGTPFPSTYYNLTINDNEATSGNRDTFQVTTTDLTVNNDLTVTSGTFSTGAFNLDIDGNYVQGANGLFNGNASTINLAGNFTNSAGVGFVGGTSTVVLDANTNHTITGNTVFNNLTFQNTSDDTTDNTLTFGNSSTYIISTNLVLDGLDADDRIVIQSDSGGNAATINVLGGSANVTADFLTVTDNTLQDNGATMNPAYDPANSTNGGNASGWFGTISGTVFTDQGVTNIGAGKTVRLLIDGADSGLTADTNASGFYEITGAAQAALTGGEVLTLYLDDETENGVVVTVTNGPSLSVDIYQDFLITRHDNSGSLTNTNLASADNADPGTSSDDISSLYTLDGSNNLTTTSGTELLVWTGDTYTPGANIIAGSNVDVDGTIDVSTNSMNIAANLDVSGTWTDAAGASITMNGTTAQTFNQGASGINSDIVIANTSAAVSLITNALDIGANNLTINTNAILSLGGLNITNATGTFDNNGTLRVNGAETTINLTQDTAGGTWEFVDDGDTTAETIAIDGTPFPNQYYNLIINSNDATPANRDTFQGGTTTLTIQNDFTITSGTYTTNGFNLTVNGNYLLDTNGLFNGTTSAFSLAGNFTNNAGAGYTAGSSSLNPTSDTDHSISGTTTFNGILFQNTTDDATSNTLTFSNGDTFTLNSSLTLDGLDADDRVLIVSDSGGNAATINVTGGSANITADFLTVTDSTLQDNGATMNPQLDPANSTNGGNTAGWFSAANVEFSSATANSTDESSANNFPTLRINGVILAATSVDVDITGGTATNSGTDYTMTDPLTVAIPAGTYDGTAGTEIVITAPTLNNDNLVESGGETIILGLTNFGTEVQSGDADGADGNESTHTYTITDDDSMVVELTTNASDAENTGGNLPQLLILGASTAASTVTVTDAGTGSATGGGTDYSFTSPQVIAIPAGTYDGTTGTAIAIPTLSITADTDLEANETIDLTLSTPTGDASLGDANTDTATTTSHTYTINNDDTATASITVTDATAAENPSDNGEFTVTLSKVNNTGGPITVNYSVGGTASAGSDFAALSGTVTIANGASTGIITINTSGLDDATTEGFKTVTLTLTGTSNSDVSIGTSAATLSITDDEDIDGDGVGTAAEDAGFNGGDGNGDGILDSTQSDVTNITNPVTSGTTTIQVSGGACNVVGNVAGLTESSLSESDDSYDYPVGLMQFLVECASAGDTATITIFYDQVYTTTNWEFRKFNDKTNTYADIDATTTVTIASNNLANGVMAGTPVTTVTYDVTDGGSLDTDANPPLSDRYILDPAGPGTPVATSSGGGGGGGVPLPQVCQDPTATNFESYGSHTPSLCTYATTDDPSTESTDIASDPGAETDSISTNVSTQTSVNAVIGSGQCSNELVISQNLRKGARDGQYEAYAGATVSEVALLQAHINRILAAEYNQAAGPVDGIFGSLTKQGVERLQTALNRILQPVPPLVIDGIVGPFTRSAINNSCGHDNQQQVETLIEEPVMEPVQEAVDEPAVGPTTTEEEVYEAITDEVVTAQCPFFSKYLIEGSESDAVRSVEVFMSTLGYDVGSADGVFDGKLRQAIIAYQQDHWEDILKPWNLGPNEGTGYLYQSTRAHMNNRAGCPICVTLDNGQRVGCDDEPTPVIKVELPETPTVTSPTSCRDTFTKNAKRGDRGDHVTELQQFLYDRGYLPEEPVGYFGPLTESAVRQFQGQYRDQILTPLGYEGTTGFWHGRTRDQANEIVCQDLIDNN